MVSRSTGPIPVTVQTRLVISIPLHHSSHTIPSFQPYHSIIPAIPFHHSSHTIPSFQPYHSVIPAIPLRHSSHTIPSFRPYHSVIPALSRNPEASFNRYVAYPRLPGFPRSRERQVGAGILTSTLNSYRSLGPASEIWEFTVAHGSFVSSRSVNGQRVNRPLAIAPAILGMYTRFHLGLCWEM